MAIPELTPLSLSELLDRTFTHYRKHFWVFVGIMALPEVAVVCAQFIYLVYRSANFAPPPEAANRAAMSLQLAAHGFLLIAAALAVTVVGLLSYTVALGATSFAVSDAHLGRMPGVSKAYGLLRPKVWKLIGLMLLFGIIMAIAYGVAMTVVAVAAGIFFVGAHAGRPLAPAAAVTLGILTALVMLAVFILVTILLLRFALSVPALMLEDLGPVPALKRSFHLTKGCLGRLFLTVLLMIILNAVAMFVFAAPFLIGGSIAGFKFGRLPLWLEAPQVISSGIGGALCGPFLIIALVLWYYEARVRKEGFDLQFMADSLDEPAAPPSIPGFSPAP